MSNGLKITCILLVILSLMLGGSLYITTKNAKSNEEALTKSIKEMQIINEKLHQQQKDIQEVNILLKREVEQLKKEIERLDNKNKELEKENKDLLKKLEAKRQQEKLMAMNSQNNSSPPPVTSSIMMTTSKTVKSSSTKPPSNNGRKVAYLTFDDGPSKNTEKILNILKANNIKATFFVNGKTDSYSKSLYRRIVNEGHAIGNHTYSHNYQKIYTSKQAFMQDFKQLENYLNSLVGVRPKIARFPGGSNNHVSWKYGGKGVTKEIALELQKQGYVYFDWNVDSTDATVVKQSKEKIIQSVVNGARKQNYAIILMHDSSAKTTTAEALPEIIRQLKQQGFTFEKLNTNSYRYQFLRP